MSDHQVTFGQADLTDCDREPIHIPGSIQPHGALLAVDPASLTILMAAGMTARFLGAAPQYLAGQPLGRHLAEADLRRLRELAAGPASLPQPILMFEATLGDAVVDAVAHFSDGLLLVELEPVAGEPGVESIDLVQGMVRRMEAAGDLASLSQAIAEEVQAATGFDRVMLYRFQEDDSGHVVAEARSSQTVESFLDLHYPASDIPVQARQLYVSNWIRSIADVGYRPAPLHPALNPRTGRPLDLSFTGLRSVSPIHLEYLANMGVAASMSLSIVIQGRLWGLIACHHLAPRLVSRRVRAACELFAQLASLQIQNRLEIDLATARLRTRDIHGQLVMKASREGLPTSLMGPEPNLLNLIAAPGVAVVAEGAVETQGLALDPARLAALLEWLGARMSDGVYATDRLREASGLDLGDGVAGLLALAISRDPQDYVLWLLPEQVRDVRWAGDPDKPVLSGPNGDRLTPRKSFESWTQTVRGRSRPWSPVEMEAAGQLRVSLLEFVLRRLDLLARERLENQVRQDLLMAELDHRVKNSLATIQSMVRFSSRSADDLVSFVTSVEKRLQAMAKTHNLLSRSRWEGAALRDLVEDELEAYTAAGDGQVTLRGPNVDLEPKAAMATSMALHELVTNAIKHGCLADPDGKLDVSWAAEQRPAGEWLVLHWRETCARPIAPPTRRGFGRTLLERVFPKDVDGEVSADFAVDGLKCVLELPAKRYTLRRPEPPSQRRGVHMAADGPPGVQGMRIFVVEDAALVAEDLSESLRGAGAHVLGPYYRLAEARQVVGVPMDLALLDVDIDGEPVWDLAASLRERGVPLILTTGYAVETQRPPEFVGLPTLTKPFDINQLQALMARLVAAPPA